MAMVSRKEVDVNRFFRVVQRFGPRVREVVKVHCPTDGLLDSFKRIVGLLVAKGELPQDTVLEVKRFMGEGRSSPHILVGCPFEATALTRGMQHYSFPYEPATDLLFPTLPQPAFWVKRGKVIAVGNNVYEWSAEPNYWLVSISWNPVNQRQVIKVERVEEGEPQPAEVFDDTADYVAKYGDEPAVTKALKDAVNRLLWGMKCRFGEKDGKFQVFLPERCAIYLVREEGQTGAFISVSVRRNEETDEWLMIQLFRPRNEENLDRFRVFFARVGQEGLVCDEMEEFSSPTEFQLEMEVREALTDSKAFYDSLAAKLEEGLVAISSGSRNENGGRTLAATAEPPSANGNRMAHEEGLVRNHIQLPPGIQGVVNSEPTQPSTGGPNIAGVPPQEYLRMLTEESVVPDSNGGKSPEPPAAPSVATEEADLKKPGRSRRAKRRQANYRHYENGDDEKE